MKLLIRPGKHRYRTVVPRSPSSGGSAVALCAVWEKLDCAEESGDTVWTQEYIHHIIPPLPAPTAKFVSAKSHFLQTSTKTEVFYHYLVHFYFCYTFTTHFIVE